MTATETKNKLCMLGESGSAKSKWIRSEFLRATDAGVEIMWFLPSISLVEHVKDLLLEQDDRKAIIETPIKTFDDWAKETALSDETLVGVVDLLPLAERLLKRIKPIGFGKVLDLPGFPKSVCSACVELIESGVTAKKLRNISGKSDRLTAMAQLLDEMLTAMASMKLTTTGQLLFRIAAKIEQGYIPIPEILLFDGFYDFTASQKTCFTTLCNACGNVRFTLPVDPDDFSRATTTSPKRMYELLDKLGFQFIEDSSKEKIGPESLFRTLFSENQKISSPVQISTLVADTKQHLAKALAQKIRRAKDTGAIKKWRMVGILCRTLQPYIETLNETFLEYGIPVSIHGALDPAQTAQGPAILGIMDAIGAHPPATRTERAASVRRIADMAGCLCRPEVLEKLQNLFAYIKNPAGQLQRRAIPPESLGDLIESTDDPEIIDLFEFLQSIENAAAADRVSSNDFISTTRMILARFAKNAFWADRVDSYSVYEAAGTLRAFARALDRFEKNAEILKTDYASWSWFTSRFRDYLKSMGIPLSERLADAVHVVDAMEGRSWSWDELFVLGMNKGEFPRKTGEDIYCNDFQREKLEPLLPTARFSKNEEELLFCFAVQAAKKRLTLARHRFDLGGGELAPSFFIDEIKAVLTETIPEENAPLSLSKPVLAQKDWVHKGNAIEASAFALGRVEHFGQTETFEDEIGRFLYQDKMAGISLPKAASNWIQPKSGSHLSPSLLPQIEKLLEPFSVSGIEQFIACPFRSFAGRILRLEPSSKIPILDGMLLGQIAHETLRAYFIGHDSKHPKNTLHKIFRSIRSQKTAMIDLTFDNEQDLQRLESALWLLVQKEHEEWLSNLGTIPLKLEWSFGQKEFCTLGAGDRKFLFRGRIDRVDKIGDALLVIDYKLSSGHIGKNEIGALPKGLLPQLPVYCAATRNLLGKEVIGGQIERIRHLDRSGIVNGGFLSESASQAFSKYGSFVLDQEDFAELLENAMEGVLDFCEEMLEGRIDINPRDSQKTCRPDLCDYYDICRIDL